MSERKADPVHGPTNPIRPPDGVLRLGSIIALRPEMEQQYRTLHANVWPEVLETLKRANVRNYNIFVADVSGQKLLFSFFEYHGSDFAVDMDRIAADGMTRKWWELTGPCQSRLPGVSEDQQWLPLESVFSALAYSAEAGR